MSKKIAVVSTGGTIASRMDPQRGSVVAAASGRELVGLLPDPPPGIDIEIVEFCNIGSYLLDLETAFRLTGRLSEILASPDVAGAVVTHGTDTMEETAFMADLLVASDKPVVFTGAQRNADVPDRDGPRNLSDAIRVAACDEARGLGAMILFDQEFHAARDATKTHTTRVGTFQSAEHGKLGEVDGDAVIVHRRPALRLTLEAERIEPAIDLVKLTMGSDARFMRCALDTGARGIVLEAFGRGNGNHEIVAATRAATDAGVPVLVTSRCPQGRVMPVYGNGGGRDLATAGAIFAGDLAGIKARVLLAVLLGASRPRTAIEAAIRHFCG